MNVLYPEQRKVSSCHCSEGYSLESLQRGQILCTPDTFSARNRFVAKVIFLSEERAGHSGAITSDLALEFYLGTVQLSGTLSPKDPQAQLQAGQIDVDIIVELSETLGLKIGQGFAIIKDGRTLVQERLRSFLL